MQTLTAVVLTEAPAIHEARLMIERAKKETWDNRAFQGGTHHDAYCLGKLQTALDQAADALFNVLNIAKSHMSCTASAEAINEWYFRDVSSAGDGEAVPPTAGAES